jgi:two-component system, chemotaxis family, protein-glutamate methylesterase/glutaminase
VPADEHISGRDVVVIGASAGGVEALGSLIAHLPEDIAASLFVVLHIPASGTSLLPTILERRGDLRAAHAVDEEPIERGRIYVAPPDHHLLLQRGVIRVVRGPRENGYRPAIDPLFRSAAHSFGPRVTGVVLSGVLDDGTAGLALIKNAGGRTLVQDPDEALYPMMPSNAIEFVGPDRILPAQELAEAITEYTREQVPAQRSGGGDQLLEEAFVRVDRGASDDPQPGEPSGYVCPACGGALWETNTAGVMQFRCRTGHAYSPETLLAEQSHVVEAGLWSALRTLEERAAMARRMSARFRARGRRSTAERFERQANAAVEQSLTIRHALAELAPHLIPEVAEAE